MRDGHEILKTRLGNQVRLIRRQRRRILAIALAVASGSTAVHGSVALAENNAQSALRALPTFAAAEPKVQTNPFLSHSVTLVATPTTPATELHHQAVTLRPLGSPVGLHTIRRDQPGESMMARLNHQPIAQIRTPNAGRIRINQHVFQSPIRQTASTSERPTVEQAVPITFSLSDDLEPVQDAEPTTPPAEPNALANDVQEPTPAAEANPDSEKPTEASRGSTVLPGIEFSFSDAESEPSPTSDDHDSGDRASVEEPKIMQPRESVVQLIDKIQLDPIVDDNFAGQASPEVADTERANESEFDDNLDWRPYREASPELHVSEELASPVHVNDSIGLPIERFAIEVESATPLDVDAMSSSAADGWAREPVQPEPVQTEPIFADRADALRPPVAVAAPPASLQTSDPLVDSIVRSAISPDHLEPLGKSRSQAWGQPTVGSGVAAVVDLPRSQTLHWGSPPSKVATASAATDLSQVPLNLASDPLDDEPIEALSLYMTRAQVRSLTIRGQLKKVSVSDRYVCQAVAAGDNQIKLIGTGNGVTRLIVWAATKSDNKTVSRAFDIHVSDPVEASSAPTSEKMAVLSHSIKQAFPGSDITIQLASEQMIVRGRCRSEDTAKKIIRMVRKTCLVPVRDELVVR